MKRIIAIACWLLATALITGCAFNMSSSLEIEALAEVEDRLEDSNALNPNALNPNALNPNALNPNALNPNALNPNSLSPAALASILDPGEAGELSRQLLSYVVGCAFARGQSFSFTWYDSSNTPHPETFTGLLGLASGWATGAVGKASQRWVTACLASRVNWYGTPVMLSSRGAHPSLRTQSSCERSAYPSEEGAFYGNLFQDSPAIYACYNEANAAHSRSRLRDCAAGHIDESGQIEDCGPVQILGSCADYCAPLDAAGLYYPGCARVLGGPTIAAVITTFLP
jgi:hypothetical protein